MPASSLLVGTLLSLILLSPPPQQTEPDEKEDGSPYQGGAFLEEDREVAKWIAKAEGYREAGEWSKCIDILQKVIEKGDESVVSSDGRLYRPVRSHCHRLIKEFGEEAIHAYRDAMDAEAKSLFDESKARRDAAGLAAVAARYFCSSIGDDALELAGDLHIDRREYSQALAAWDELYRHYPEDTDVDRAYLAAKMAFVSSRLGRDGPARDYLEEAIRLAAGRPFRIAGETITEEGLRERLLPGVEDPTPPDPMEWPTAGGNAAHCRESVSIPEGMKLEFHWLDEFENVQVEQETPDRSPYGYVVPRFEDLPSTAIVISGGTVITRDRGVLLAYHLGTYKRKWYPHKHEDGRSARTAGGSAYPWGSIEDFGRSSITVADGKVIVMEGKGRSAEISHRMVWGAPPQGGGSTYLAAYDIETGDPLWRSEEDEGLRIACAPTAWEGRLYVPAEQEGQFFVLALDLDDGRLIWKTFICGSPGNQIIQAGIPVAVEGGFVYALSSAGVVAAVDANVGALEWAARYESRPIDSGMSPNFWAGRNRTKASPEGWAPSAPIVRDGRLLIAPSDSNYLLCLNSITGALDWRQKKDKQTTHLIGATSDRVITGGKRIFAHDITTGKVKWVSELRDKYVGRGVVSRDHVYVPLKDRIVRFDIAGGKRDLEYAIPVDLEGEKRSGNLWIIEGELLVSARDGVASYRFIDEKTADEEAIPAEGEDRKEPAAPEGPDEEAGGESKEEKVSDGE